MISNPSFFLFSHYFSTLWHVRDFPFRNCASSLTLKPSCLAQRPTPLTSSIELYIIKGHGGGPYPLSFCLFGTTTIAHSIQIPIFVQKVSFNIASEASFIYILSGQKFTENVKNSQFWHFPPIFGLLKEICLVTLFHHKIQLFKNSQKLTDFWHF